MHYFTEYFNRQLPEISRHETRLLAEIRAQVLRVPKHLDEKVARLHLAKLGVKLTKMSDRQAAYIGVPVTGPYKSDHYRY